MQKAQKGLYNSKLYWTLSDFSSAVTGRVSISAFASKVGIAIGIRSSSLGLKFCVINAAVKNIDQ